jgi:hypothetical protein
MLTTDKPQDMKFSQGDFVIQAAAKSDDGKVSNRKFEMTAYTGGAMRLMGFWSPVVVDLEGINLAGQSRPIYIDHTPDIEHLVGQTDSIKISGGKLLASGEIMGESDTVKSLINLADKGFKWQASIGARAEKMEYVPEGKSVKVNGKQHNGPINVAWKSVIAEISFVALGADTNTAASIAAKDSFEYKILGVNPMEKDELKAGDTPQAEPTKKIEAAAPAKVEAAPDPIAEMRAQAAAEVERIGEIRAKCSDQPAIMAKAIKEGWTAEKAELECLKAMRDNTPQVAGINVPKNEITASVMEAALLMAGGIRGNDLIKSHGYEEIVVSAADKQFKGRIGLQQALLEAAWLNGFQGRHFGSTHNEIKEVLAYAFPQDIRAGFSTLSLPGILSNTANKFLLEAFNAIDQSWREISAIRNVSDFKTVTSYRLNGSFEYEEVGPTGELKHGTTSEDSYTNQAKTYGKMFAITRTDLINDDLGAFMAIPQQIGQGAADKLNTVFWATFLADTAFFIAGNNNYDDGTDTAIGFSGLALAQKLFYAQTKPNGKPLGLRPAIILTPAGDAQVAAEQLYKSLEIRDTTANTKTLTSNIFGGKYRPVMSPFLTSTTAWYLLADPRQLATIEVAFLNGKQEPIIESADADFNTLGIQIRGYHDFGVALKEYRAGVKMKGTT